MKGYSSSYIQGLPEAEFELMDQPLGETFIDRFLEKNKGTLANTFANLIDTYAADEKGRLFTLAIAASGYTNDIQGLQNFYSINEKVIDKYFSFIDMKALANAIGGNLEKEIVDSTAQWIRTRMPAFIAGAGLIAGYVYISKKRSS
ncbi:hypothetical protein [Gracilimonas sediminicola]|uniref:hypothetical protein n=1 Tax=Gracilimonas sediminicola TaxID=2952158 RepID=UPI0038D40ADC